MVNNETSKEVDAKREWLVFFKYVIAGATSVGMQFGLLYLFVDIFHLFSPIASTLAYVITTICLYLMLYHWVFISEGKHGVLAVRYSVTSLAMLGLNFFIFWLMAEYFGLWYIYSQIGASSINRLYTFK
jgi:putative flippase GtrA